MNPKLTPERLRKKAVVYVRQSKPSQLIQNQESKRLQYRLMKRLVKNTLRRLGYDLVRYDPAPRITTNEMELIARDVSWSKMEARTL